MMRVRASMLMVRCCRRDTHVRVDVQPRLRMAHLIDRLAIRVCGHEACADLAPLEFGRRQRRGLRRHCQRRGLAGRLLRRELSGLGRLGVAGRAVAVTLGYTLSRAASRGSINEPARQHKRARWVAALISALRDEEALVVVVVWWQDRRLATVLEQASNEGLKLIDLGPAAAAWSSSGRITAWRDTGWSGSLHGEETRAWPPMLVPVGERARHGPSRRRGATAGSAGGATPPRGLLPGVLAGCRRPISKLGSPVTVDLTRAAK